MSKIDIHADDFAISLHASHTILDCVKAGEVGSISVIPNMSCFDECMELLQSSWNHLREKPLISVHLNFMEGKSCCKQEEVSGLVDQDGLFRLSWGDLLKASYSRKRAVGIKNQLKKEMIAQIDRVKGALPEGCELRIDSHQHTHMIPMVFGALLQAIDERDYKVAFIRVAKEPMLPFVKKIKLYPTYSPVNIAKNIILNFYAVPMNRELKRRGISTGLLWGLVMSGRMDLGRIQVLYNSMLHYCGGKNQDLEILFHPGSVLPEEVTDEYGKKGFVDFHLSEGRSIERKAVRELGGRG